MTTETKPRPELLLTNLQMELDSAHLYRYLAAREADGQRASLLVEMAEAETRHAAVMERGLREQGVSLPPTHHVSFKTRLLKLVARLGGPGAVYPLLHGTEISGTADYAAQDARTAALAPEERSHARTLGELSRGIARGERWHRSAGGGTLRAAVFGVNDGLVSNLSLVMGFAGAGADAEFVLLAGLAGLLAGASSMAAGEYVSMKAQRELFERQIDLEAAELAVTPEEEVAELALIYRAKGLAKDEAQRLASRITEDPEVALATLVREELGLDPSELGSPWGAAIGSFFAFALGAVVPVLAYFSGAGWAQLCITAALSGVALFLVGVAVSL